MTPRNPDIVGSEQPAPVPPVGLQPDGGPWLNIVSSANYANVSPRTIRRAIQDGRLRASRPARMWRILRADLDAFMKAAER
ncbi:helix-turn-helix domain-containing protein [Microbacterium sp. AZCO]|uniref:helix-turn-helix domain-containing protein n=1 Tax=Microbacterium sp. AZCO TaxID=3142976 RepID=UPI0031F4082E